MKVKNQVENQVESHYEPQILRVIYTPSGICPVKLHNTTADAVHEWADAVREYGYKFGKQYSVAALRYWVRQFYELDSEEHALVCELLLKIW